MDKPYLLWKNYHPNRGSHYYGDQVTLHRLLKDHFQEKFDADAFEGMEGQGAVVVIRGGDNLKYVDKLNADIAKLKWCVIIITGNEGGTGLHRLIKHPNFKVWVQTPKAGDRADYFIGCGFPTEELFKLAKYNDPTLHKTYEWFFAGQVTQDRRYKCVDVLKKMPNGRLIETAGFYQGVPYPEYIELMQQSKVIPCPGGALTPDSFRVYEALELGCIPVVDMHSGYEPYNGNYWTKVFGEVPFPLIEDWNDFPDILNGLMDNFESKRDEICYWWASKKVDIVINLLKHIREIE